MLDIVRWPDKRLKQACKPVIDFETDELLEQIKGMVDAMWGYGGIGLAANQVGFDNRVIVVAKEPGSFPKTTPLVLINPVIERRSSKKQTMNEGCLSFAGITKYRRRSKSIGVIARDYRGLEFRWKAEGLAAQCIQHEMDHINGKTFLDK